MKPAVFLDRDGVINEEVNLLHRCDQLRLTQNAAAGIRLLNEAGLPVIVVTNQPVVARGMCTEANINAIHAHLQDTLRAEGARLDAVYFCPHHENADLPEYRKQCPDRKPGTGMFQRAAREHDIALEQSFLVGDRTVDIKAGKDAGCYSILVQSGYGGADGTYPVLPDAVCIDIGEAAIHIVEKIREKHLRI